MHTKSEAPLVIGIPIKGEDGSLYCIESDESGVFGVVTAMYLKGAHCQIALYAGHRKETCLGIKESKGIVANKIRNRTRDRGPVVDVLWASQIPPYLGQDLGFLSCWERCWLMAYS